MMFENKPNALVFVEEVIIKASDQHVVQTNCGTVVWHAQYTGGVTSNAHTFEFQRFLQACERLSSGITYPFPQKWDVKVNIINTFFVLELVLSRDLTK